jgi:hypothetical protein
METAALNFGLVMVYVMVLTRDGVVILPVMIVMEEIVMKLILVQHVKMEDL